MSCGCGHSSSLPSECNRTLATKEAASGVFSTIARLNCHVLYHDVLTCIVYFVVEICFAWQTYCNMNSSLAGGGWAMVWKHSYFQIDKSQLNNMRSYSSFYKPCLDLSDGWCNVPDKQPKGYKEQMVAAYHNKNLVYAYRGTLNSQLGRSNSGPYLNSATRVVDKCKSGVGRKPSISTHSSAEPGITFDKWSPDDFNSNCDTDWNDYKNDCRWENCQLPSSVSPTRSTHTQMTVVIYIR